MLNLTKQQLFKILILYLILALAAIFCYNTKNLLSPARKRPFQCNDESLRKPFVHDTVTPKELHILGVYMPIAVIAGCELVSSLAARKSLRNSSWFFKYVLQCGRVLTLFLVGLAFERVLKNVAKIKMGRLRPNFITVCEPIDHGYKCQGLDDPTIMDGYECSSTVGTYPSWAVSTAYSSFPSGHTSLASYSMVFLMCYLSLLFLKVKNLGTSLFSLVILFMQAFCFSIMLFVAISRVLDFRHHWSDVFSGFICGSIPAVILNCYLRTQQERIDKWLGGVVGDKVGENEVKACCVNENTKQKEETCAIQLEV